MGAICEKGLKWGAICDEGLKWGAICEEGLEMHFRVVHINDLNY